MFFLRLAKKLAGRVNHRLNHRLTTTAPGVAPTARTQTDLSSVATRTYTQGLGGYVPNLQTDLFLKKL